MNGTINLHNVVMKTYSDQVLITFTSYGPMDPEVMTPPRGCGTVGVRWTDQNVTVENWPAGSSNVPEQDVQVTYPDAHSLQLVVPRSDLGSEFSATEPWIAFADGPNCPPMAVAAETMPEATPSG